ncbi:MAG: hypothetical protein C5B55_06090 [Blastocatellia bacterium]|nr:MAG: hypothetical protein C5B55_06090 [Blastocatellia bacterium]
MYTNESEIEAVVSGFEDCTTGKAGFRHADHLTVAAWYLLNGSHASAIEKMRAGLLRFIDHHGVDPQKYHETLTVFWVELTAQTLRQCESLESLVDKCNFVVQGLGDKNICLQFYSPELLATTKAREVFVQPDLKPLAG